MVSRAFVCFVMCTASGLCRRFFLWSGVLLLFFILPGCWGVCSARCVRVREGWERGDLTGEVFFSCLGWFVEGNGDGTDSTLPSIVTS